MILKNAKCEGEHVQIGTRSWMLPEMCVEVVLFPLTYIHHHFAAVRNSHRETRQYLIRVSV